MFGGLRMQSQTDGSSVSNIFEGSSTEEETGPGTDIFEGEFMFVDADARHEFDIRDSADQGAIGERLGRYI